MTCLPVDRRAKRIWMVLAALLATPGFIGCSDATNILPPEPLAASGFFESDGLQIHYESFGEGEPIILVHGWGTDLSFNWGVTGWIEELQTVRQVIAIDIRGHGDSDKPLEQALYSYSTMARDVLNLMDTFGIEKADFMGYSLGSFSGAYLLGHHTDRFSSMVLGGIGDETEESIATAEPIAAALRADDPSEISDPIGLEWRQFVDIDPRNDEHAREALALAALQMWPEGFPLELGGEGLRSVNIPVLIVNGADDIPYVNTVHPFADAIPGARLVMIPDRDHFGAVFDPLFKEEVLGFLRANDEAR
ncbi:MAG: alpha/beta hydrolase [Polyangiales bacterium]